MMIQHHYTEPMVMWRVGELLEQNGITAYKLSDATKGQVSRNTVYKIANAKTERVDLTTLSALLSALNKLTGHNYQVGDLLQYIPDED